MPNILNNQAADIVYSEVTHNHECRVELCFAWVDDRLFLPASLLDDDPAQAAAKVLSSDTDVYSRGSLNYFVPVEWLEAQRPDRMDFIANLQKAAEPFNRKFSGDPCSICLKGHSGNNAD